jgi:glucose-1-phosphate cytidylyltransferase
MVILMKVLILAGGFGTRLIEENETRPKPMVEIGGKPILWHIMKIYSYCGLTDFVVHRAEYLITGRVEHD